MEGAKALIIGAPFLQMYMGRDHIDNVIAAQDLVHHFLRIVHIYSF